MIRTRTSLKDRGLELLGMTRRQPVHTAAVPPLQREGTLPDERVMTKMVSSSSAHVGARTRYYESEREVRHLREIREIEKLLREEADMAVGGEEEAKGTLPPSAPPEEAFRLPAEEWIAPVPVTAIRPLPAPPPDLTADHGLPSSPSTEVRIPSGEQEIEDIIPPEKSLLTPAVPSPETPPVPQSSTEIVARLAALEQVIEAEYERIRREQVSVSQEITNWCHQLLMEAHNIVTQNKLEELPRAEWCIEQVRTRLDRARRSASQVHTSVALTLWGIGWFFVLVYLIFDPVWMLKWVGLSETADFFINPSIFLRALVFGGLGGVAGIFYHLFKYVRERSFDEKHTLSYLGKPFMGMILGAMTYLGMFVFMRILGMKPVGLQVSDAEMLTHVLYMAALYLVAIALGFKENRVFNLLNRAIKAVLGGEIRRSQVEGI